jgi:hypothetical protein
VNQESGARFRMEATPLDMPPGSRARMDCFPLLFLSDEIFSGCLGETRESLRHAQDFACGLPLRSRPQFDSRVFAAPRMAYAAAKMTTACTHACKAPEENPHPLQEGAKDGAPIQKEKDSRSLVTSFLGMTECGVGRGGGKNLRCVQNGARSCAGEAGEKLSGG